jgi:hypothetical protein
MTSHRRREGLGWAYAGVALGGAVSVAANVAHSLVPPADAPAGWRPMHGAVLAAVFWPVALFVAIEILARTTWPAGTPWRLVRLGGLLPVALVAAVVSYRHLSGLIRYYGEDGLTATFGPLAVDGLMAVASAALLAVSAQSEIVASAIRETVATTASAALQEATPDEVLASVTEPDALRREPVLVERDQPAAARRRSQLEDARAFVRAELAAGRSPSGAAVGRSHGRNSRWGQRIVREVFQEQASAATAQDLQPSSQSAAPTPETTV